MRQLTALIAATIALAACSGAAPPTPQSTQATQASASTAVSTAAVAATKAPSAPTSGPNISDVLKAGKATTYKATYTQSITAAGQTAATEQTWYAKGANTRFDFSAGPGALISVYSLADGTFLCTSAGGTAFCQKTAAQAAFVQNPAADFALQLQGDPSKFAASFTGSQTLAGQQAQCFSVKSVAGGAFGDVNTCYSSNGVPLKTTIAAAGSTVTTEATAFTTDVSDADFVLPAAAR